MGVQAEALLGDIQRSHKEHDVIIKRIQLGQKVELVCCVCVCVSVSVSVLVYVRA